MTTIKYNDFRNSHKGKSQKEISLLWAKYKAGEYEVPSFEPTEKVEIILPDPEPEAPKKVKTKKEKKTKPEVKTENIGDLCKEYMAVQKKLKLIEPRLSEQDLLLAHQQLEELANKTIPKEYKCTPTDSWKIWLGPTSRSLLINTTNPMAFEVTREWWQKHYQNTIYVDRELLNNNDLIDIEIRRYHRLGRFLPRTPVVGKECKLPQGVKDIQIRGGQGIN